MSTPISITFAPAEPGCCVRTCQDIIDLISASITGNLPDDFHGIIISSDTPDETQRDNLWIKVTVDGEGCVTGFIDILVWSCSEGEWISFTFNPATITPGAECTILGTAPNGGGLEVQHRTMSQLIDCIADGQIPCGKINFGVVPTGAQYQTWEITIEANADSVAAGRIEFDVSWTSATCGVGRLFVTESPITGGNQYTISVCMPSDAASITITNLKGTEVGGWSNTTVNCTPDSCLPKTGTAKVAVYNGAIPTVGGAAGAATFAHGLGAKPDVVVVEGIAIDSSFPGLVAGDAVNLETVILESTNDQYMKYTRYSNATNVVVWTTADTNNGDFILPTDGSKGSQVFDPAKFTLRITAIKFQ